MEKIFFRFLISSVIRPFYLFYFFFCIIFNINIRPPRGSYNSQKKVIRVKQLKKSLKSQIKIFKKKNKNRNFNIIEIGSYIGGSTISLGETLYGSLGNRFNLFCVDPFKPFSSKNEKEWAHHEMSKTIEKIYFYFLYRVSKTKYRSNIIHLRDSIINLQHVFNKYDIDYIYIDGSHYYKDVIIDLETSYKLIKKRKDYQGIICGDDLEINLFDKKFEHIKISKNSSDMIKIDNEYYHPGVSLALYDFAKKKN